MGHPMRIRWTVAATTAALLLAASPGAAGEAPADELEIRQRYAARWQQREQEYEQARERTQAALDAAIRIAERSPAPVAAELSPGITQKAVELAGLNGRLWAFAIFRGSSQGWGADPRGLGLMDQWLARLARMAEREEEKARHQMQDIGRMLSALPHEAGPAAVLGATEELVPIIARGLRWEAAAKELRHLGAEVRMLQQDLGVLPPDDPIPLSNRRLRERLREEIEEAEREQPSPDPGTWRETCRRAGKLLTCY